MSDQHCPDEAEATSNNACADRPSFSANTNASETAIMETPRIMLLQIFAACPAPGPPQCTICRPMACRSGCARANASSDPPTMKVSVPAAAPPVPPETGASMQGIPPASARACASLADPTSIVEQSISSVPGTRAGPSARYTSSTCAPPGSMVMTVPASRAASDKLSAIATPEAGSRRTAGRGKIEAAHRVSLADEVGGHRQAHVAETDKADHRHTALSLIPCVRTGSPGRAPAEIMARAGPEHHRDLAGTIAGAGVDSPGRREYPRQS